jgi:hypothetical protein
MDAEPRGPEPQLPGTVARRRILPPKPTGEPWVEIPIGTRSATCIGHVPEVGGTCTQTIYFVYNPRTEKSSPISIDFADCRAPDPKRDPDQADLFSAPAGVPRPGRGVSHWADCPDVALIRDYMRRKNTEFRP